MCHAMPPKFGEQPARHGPCCLNCEFYVDKEDKCGRFSIKVRPNNVCDAWKRNPSLEIEAV